MVSGQLTILNRYRNKSEEEKEKIRNGMAENYYKKTEGKVKRRNKSRKYMLNVK